jgi:sec-independent protein translocase protein TatA
VSLPGGWELVLVVIVIMVLFGAKRLPDASRSLGRSLRIFKAETKGLRDDSDTTVTDTTSGTTTTARQEPLPPVDPTQPRQP